MTLWMGGIDSGSGTSEGEKVTGDTGGGGVDWGRRGSWEIGMDER